MSFLLGKCDMTKLYAANFLFSISLRLPCFVHYNIAFSNFVCIFLHVDVYAQFINEIHHKTMNLLKNPLYVRSV